MDCLVLLTSSGWRIVTILLWMPASWDNRLAAVSAVGIDAF